MGTQTSHWKWIISHFSSTAFTSHIQNKIQLINDALLAVVARTVCNNEITTTYVEIFWDVISIATGLRTGSDLLVHGGLKEV